MFGMQGRVPAAGVPFQNYCCAGNARGYSITAGSLLRHHVTNYRV
jgi:hypothetical protein